MGFSNTNSPKWNGGPVGKRLMANRSTATICDYGTGSAIISEPMGSDSRRDLRLAQKRMAALFTFGAVASHCNPHYDQNSLLQGWGPAMSFWPSI